MPTARPMMFASASGELKTRSLPYICLQPVRDLEDAALAGDLAQRRFAAGVGHVLAEHDDAGSRAISSCSVVLIAATIVSGVSLRRWLGGERRRRGIDRRREDEARRRFRLGLRRRERAVGRLVHLALDLGARTSASSSSVASSSASEQVPHAEQRIAPRLGLPLLRRLVELLVVGERVRVRPGDRRMHERRSLARAHVGDGLSAASGGWPRSRCRRSARRAVPESARRGARYRRPASALRLASRWRSRCLRRGRAPAACGCRPCSAIPRTRLRWSHPRRS